MAKNEIYKVRVWQDGTWFQTWKFCDPAALQVQTKTTDTVQDLSASLKLTVLLPCTKCFSHWGFGDHIIECKLQTNEPNIPLNIVIKFGINLHDGSSLDQVDLTPSWLNRLRCLRPPYFSSSLCLPLLCPHSLSLHSTFTMKYWWNSNLSLTRPCSPSPSSPPFTLRLVCHSVSNRLPSTSSSRTHLRIT